MNEQQYDIGMVGLGVMGRNFVLNMADNGYSVAGLDTDPDKAKALDKESGELHVNGFTDVKEFVSSLKKPRSVIMLVPAGKAVDSVIDELVPILDKGDLIIDGGNSHFTDTERHFDELKDKGIHFMGMGISGGEKGARFGPSMMPGGTESVYDRVKPILEAAAAKVDGDPCVTFLGPRSAGHYVKMVHNGIEYAIMQILAESYQLMKDGLGMSNEQLHETYKSWNEAELDSFLVEITAEIFAKHDDKGDGWLIDKIKDSAKQKGTGKWTSQDAMELQVAVPTLDIAVAMRDLSGFKSDRDKAGDLYKLNKVQEDGTGNHKDFVAKLKNAVYFGMIASYAQGMHQLRVASDHYKFNLNLKDVARIWRGGCIIRAALLEDIRAAYDRNPDLSNLMLDSKFADKLQKAQSDLRYVVSRSVEMGVPVPALSVSLGYFDAYRSSWMPANLIQAQRDDFGSHTYERVDQEGTFHSEWSKS